MFTEELYQPESEGKGANSDNKNQTSNFPIVPFMRTQQVCYHMIQMTVSRWEKQQLFNLLFSRFHWTCIFFFQILCKWCTGMFCHSVMAWRQNIMGKQPLFQVIVDVYISPTLHSAYFFSLSLFYINFLYKLNFHFHSESIYQRGNVEIG